MPSEEVSIVGTGRSRENWPVRRITIDEKMGERLIRVLVCGLADGVHEFSDQLEDWGAEQEFLVRPQNYAKVLGLPAGEQHQKEYAWDGLSEGQVFLSGEFEVAPRRGGVADDPKAPTKFQVSPGRKEFMRIDQIKVFRERVKSRYSDLLQRKS